MRYSRLRSLAKLNLDLRVLNKRTDGYHELRTVFQTISLADTIDVEFERARRTEIVLAGNVDIPDNLIVRAAQAVCAAGRVTGRIRFRLVKRIPMGAGLGGGSSNAATVLLGLPALAGVRIELETLRTIGAALGSDVPFFLFGGAALGLGRGTELFPLPDLPAQPAVLLSPGVHVSTAEAYRALGRGLTTSSVEPDTSGFQSLVWGMGEDCLQRQWSGFCANDFESAVFSRYPEIKSIQRKLRRAGARPARMTGSGSTVFGLFERREQALEVSRSFGPWASKKGIQLNVVSLVGRKRYRALWWKQLREHISENLWPPPSRYSKE